MKILRRETVCIVSVAAITALIILLALVGAVRGYSPVPYWDMWGGYLGFFLRIQAGDFASWWAQHNEHRIVLARLLFWADIKWFGGTSFFLIVVNYILVSAAALLLYRILRTISATERPSAGEVLLSLFLTAWLFLWAQQENLTWGFQSQFFLAQLLPLCAFYWLGLSDGGAFAKRRFVVACAFGVASAGAMANGVLALPFMMIFVVAKRQGTVRIVVLTCLSMLVLFLYFHDYRSPANHGSSFLILAEKPLEVVLYIFNYLGSPFYYIFGEGVASKRIALLAGFALIFLSGLLLVRKLRSGSLTSLRLGLLFFISYIVATATVTAVGRVFLGADQAFSSRYTTPALMAWGVLLVLFSEAMIGASKAWQRCYLFAMIFLLVCIARQQLHALHPPEDVLFKRQVAALALELQVKDIARISSVFPSMEAVLPIAKDASAKGLSVFGQAPLSGALMKLGSTLPSGNLPQCTGSEVEIEVIVSDERFVRIRGRIHGPVGTPPIRSALMLNKHGRVIGYAITARSVIDSLKTGSEGFSSVAFEGYLLSENAGSDIVIRGENSKCELSVRIPVAVCSAELREPSLTNPILGSSLILTNQWRGADFERTNVGGIAVFGSYIRGDADKGAISLRMKRGDRLFYRSGPAGTKQFFNFAGNQAGSMKLPAAPEWVLLNFSSTLLPEQEFIGTFTDDGDGWGEWSAIALRKD